MKPANWPTDPALPSLSADTWQVNGLGSVNTNLTLNVSSPLTFTGTAGKIAFGASSGSMGLSGSDITLFSATGDAILTAILSGDTTTIGNNIKLGDGSAGTTSLSSSGTGLLKVTGNITGGTGAGTPGAVVLSLGSTDAQNGNYEVAGNITKGATATTLQVTMRGSGTATLTGVNSFNTLAWGATVGTTGILRVNGGTTEIGSIAGTGLYGQTLKVSAGTVNVTNNARLVRTSIVVDGGTLNFNGGDRLSFNTSTPGSTFSMSSGVVNHNLTTGFGVRFGGDSGAGSSGFAFIGTQSGGTFTVKGAGGQDSCFQLGSTTASITTAYAHSGGILDIQGSTGANAYLTIGADGAGTSTTTYTLSGTGKLVVRSVPTAGSGGSASVSGINGKTASAKQVLSLQGGTLVAGRVDATNLRGSAGGSNGTLENNGSTISPGDIGTAGKTAIVGNLTINSGSLAIDLGGTTNTTTFQTNATGFCDVVAVTGTATLGGKMTANLIGNYAATPPAATTAITILTAGSIVGTGASLGYSGYVPVTVNGTPNGNYFQAVVIGNNVVLTNYGVTLPPTAASFTPANATGVAPFAANFTDTSTGVITNRYWNFGDGNTLTTNGTAVFHTYSVIGTYTNILTVTSLSGATSSATGVVNATSASVSLTWKGDGVANVWNTSTANWLNGAAPATYADPDVVTFDDTGFATPNIAINFMAQPASVTFNNSSKNYTIGGTGGINGGASVTINGSGTVTLLTTNTCTGPTTVNSGTLQLGNGTTAGSLDSSSAITNNSALVFNQPDNHNIVATISGSGSLTKTGNGTLTLGADNSLTFSGALDVNGGTLAAATDNSLGSGAVTLNNGTLQYNTSGGFTLSRSLTLNGTSDGLNVNSTVILPNSPSGLAAVKLGGNGMLQIDSGGTSVSLPTNVILNGASITYQRSDIYAQPGYVSGNSVSSIIKNSGTSAGNTNTLTFANGVNVFGSIQNASAGVLVLDGSLNSTNILGGLVGLSYSGNASLVVNGGVFTATNANIVGSSTAASTGSLIVKGGVVNAANVSGTDGGSRHFKGNLVVDGGTFRVSSGRLSMDGSSGSQSLTLSSGNLIFDNSSGGSAFGFRFGNDGGYSPLQGSFAFTGTQTGGALLCSNGLSGIVLGGITPGLTISYTQSGGTATVVGGAPNLNIGSDTNGTGSTTYTLSDTAKLTVFNAIQGTTPASTALQVFSFLGGTLTAGTVDMTYLRDTAANPAGTLVNQGGILAPGDAGAAGRTTVTGNYAVSNSAAVLDMDIGGLTAASFSTTNASGYYDKVAASGSVQLDGNLVLRLIDGFEPSVAHNSSFTIVTGASINGVFTNVASGSRLAVIGYPNRSFRVTVNATSVVLDQYQTDTPQSYFTQDVNHGTNTLTVTFTNLSNGSGLTNLWSFGDGNISTSTSPTVTHTYTAPGTNNVSLTVGSALGVSTYTNTNGVVVVAQTTPASVPITYTENSGQLMLSWPNGQGWVLQSQTNNLATGLGTNWVPVTGATSPFTNAVNPANGSVFYRLVYP